MFEKLVEMMKLDHAGFGSFLEMAGLASGGEFSVTINMVGENSPRREKLNFKPSPEAASIIHHVVKKIKNVEMMERLEVRRADGTGGFARVFPRPEDRQIEFK